MSIEHMSWVWKHSKHKGAALLLLLAIADYANHQGIAWPARESLAKKIRMSERYTRNLLNELLNEKPPELRLVEMGGGSKFNTNTYQIMMLDPETRGEARLPPEKNRGEARLPQGGRPASEGGRPASARGEAGLPQTTINHQLTITTTTTAGNADESEHKTPAAAAAVEHGEGWSLSFLMSSGKVHKKRMGQIQEMDPPPASDVYVSYYLYAMAAKRIDSPPLWSAKQIVERPGTSAGEPFDTLAAIGPAGMAEVLAWLRDDCLRPLQLNGSVPAALAFRGALTAKHKDPANVRSAAYAAINELGLSRLVPSEAAAIEDLEIEPPAPRPEPEPMDAWQTIVHNTLRHELNADVVNRLKRCQLLEEAGERLIVAVATRQDFDWINNRIAREFEKRWAVQFVLKEK